MMSRSPGKAPTTRALSDLHRRLRGLTPAASELSRHAAALSLASGAVFVAMTALEFLYFRRLSGGLSSLDLRVAGFTPDEGMAWLTALGRRGSEIVIVWHYLTFDLLFPALFSVTLASVILAAGRRLPRFRRLSDRAQLLLAAGVVAPYTLADYAQNVAVARLLSDFLHANPDSLSLASALVVTKFAFMVVPLAVIATFVLAARRRKNVSPGEGR